jgi:PPP family 3-phenylpropionic acid transporter
VAAQGIGFWLSARGDRPADPLMPLMAVAFVAGYALLLNAPRAQPASQIQGADRPVQSPHFRDALGLLRNPGVVSLLLLCWIHWAACAPYHLLFGVLVRDEGLPAAITGAGLAIGVLGELVALWAFPPLLRRFQLPALLAASCGATALRWWFVSRAHGATAIVLLQLFHAATFGLWWACAVEAMGRRSATGCVATDTNALAASRRCLPSRPPRSCSRYRSAR